MKPLYPEDVICPHCGVRVADHSLEGIWVCAEAWEMTKNEVELERLVTVTRRRQDDH